MSRHDLGDGDPCPMGHGNMYSIKGSQPAKQHCADQSHDGSPKTAPGGEAPTTRSIWPLADGAFTQAVAEYRAAEAARKEQTIHG